MSQRGRNRSGYYLAVLYALELHYELSSQAGQREPSCWQPLPRNRPDQFLQWLLHCLATLGAARPVTLCELLELLKHKELPHVTRAVAWVLDSQAGTELDAFLLLEPSLSAKERHPQVRKYAKAIALTLDPAWQRALRLALRSTGNDWPKGAVLLGGLPLDINTLGEQVFACLAEVEALGGYTELSVQQCYALVSGKMPETSAPWRGILELIKGLNGDELQLLKSLSEAQGEQIRALTEQAVKLIIQESKRYSSLQWKAIAGLLTSITREDFAQVVAFLSDLKGMSTKEREGYLVNKLKTLRTGNVSVKFLISHGASRGKRFLRMLQETDHTSWRQLQSLDEEVFRLIASRRLSARLRRHLQRWSPRQWQEVRALFDESDVLTSIYLSDREAAEELISARSAAQLSLAELFPNSMDFLNDYYRANLEELLLEDVDDVKASAQAFHERIRRHLLHELQVGG